MTVPRKPSWRRLAAALSVFVLLGPAPWFEVVPPPADHRQLLTATPIVYPPGAGDERRIGALEYREGWILDSSYTGFGGFSGMALIGPRRFLLAADTGTLTGFTLAPDGAITRPFIAPVKDGPGDPKNKFNRDLEALTASPDGETFWVAFEHVNAIWKYRTAFSVVAGEAYPPLMRDWPKNSGPEAMTRLADGRFLVLSEGQDEDPRGLAAILFLGDPTQTPDAAIPFFYDPQGKGKPTDAVELPDRRILILHRQLSFREGFVSTIAIADLEGLGKDDVLRSRTVTRLAPPHITENFEAMTIEREGRDWMLWLVSDDNQMGFQRSLLVKYRIHPELLAAPAPGFAR